jgi:hypothetical protein
MSETLDICDRAIAYCEARARIALSPIRRAYWQKRGRWWQDRLPYVRWMMRQGQDQKGPRTPPDGPGTPSAPFSLSQDPRSL